MNNVVYGVWHGGSNYSQGYREEDLERFDSIAAAKQALLDRTNLGHWYPQEFAFVNKPAEHSLTPAAYEGPSIMLYATPDSEEPFRLLEVGPRGGVKETNL